MARPATLAIRIVADASGVTSGMRSAEGSLSRFSTALGRIGKAAAAAGVTAAAIGITQIGRAAVSAASDAQRSQAALEGLYNAAGHGAQEAARAGKLMQDAFSSSVIDMSAFNKGAESLAYLGLNANETVGVLKTLETAIVATGGSSQQIDQVTSALTEMGNKGKVSMEDINRISQAGLPIMDMLAAKWGTDIPAAMDKISKGGVQVTDVIDAIQQKGGTYYQGLEQGAAKVEQSFSSIAASAKNQVINTLANELQPLLQRLGPLMATAAAGMSQGITTAATVIGSAMSAMQAFVGVVVQVGTQIAQTAADWSPLIAAVGAFVAVLAGPYMAAVVAANVQGLIWVARLAVQQAAITAVSIATRAWAVAQTLLNAVMSANPIVLVVAVIAALAAGIYVAYQRSETFRAIVQTVWNTLKSWAGYIAGGFKTVWDAMVTGFTKARDAVQWVIDKVKSVINWFKKIYVPQALKGIKDAFNSIKNAISDAIGWIDKFKSALDNIPGGGVISGMIPGMPFAASLAGARGLGSPAMPMQLAARSPRAAGAIPVNRPNVTVMVTIDGQQLQGRVERTVSGALRRDGRRLANGGWA